jgi:hypothetical protein
MNGKLIRINKQITVAYLKILGRAVIKVIDRQSSTTATRVRSSKNLGFFTTYVNYLLLFAVFLHLFILRSLKSFSTFFTHFKMSLSNFLLRS